MVAIILLIVVVVAGIAWAFKHSKSEEWEQQETADNKLEKLKKELKEYNSDRMSDPDYINKLKIAYSLSAYITEETNAFFKECNVPARAGSLVDVWALLFYSIIDLVAEDDELYKTIHFLHLSMAADTFLESDANRASVVNSIDNEWLSCIEDLSKKFGVYSDENLRPICSYFLKKYPKDLVNDVINNFELSICVTSVRMYALDLFPKKISKPFNT